MTLNDEEYDVEKYQLIWLRVLDWCERTWVQVLCVLTLSYFRYILIQLNHVTKKYDN